jgi:hypothetical protein
MRIPLPWPKKGFDGKWYWAKLAVFYTSTQDEVLNKKADEITQAKRKEVTANYEKQLRSRSLRKCRGHKESKLAVYNEKGQCSVCGGYKY